MWGLQDGVVNTHSSQILGFEFRDYTNPFAIYQLIQSLSVFLFMIVQGESVDGIKETKKLYDMQLTYTIMMGALGLVALSLCMCF